MSPQVKTKGGTRMVALLRGINVGGNRLVPMQQLTKLATEAGFLNVQTYIQSGNVVFDSTLTTLEAESALEQIIVNHFGFEVPVIVRSASQWIKYAKSSPFKDAEEQHPNLLHLALSKLPPEKSGLADLQKRAKGGERLQFSGDALWIDFASGVGRSKLTPAVLDRAIGSPVTARNFKTVIQLAQMMQKKVA